MMNRGMNPVDVLKTIAIYLVSVALASYVLLDLSMMWGVLLFLSFAILVGMPLMGVEEPVRVMRFAVFVVAMVWLAGYTFGWVRYDPFSPPVHVMGDRCQERDFSLRSTVYNIHQRYTSRSVDFYTCFMSDNGIYLVEFQGRDNMPQTDRVDGFFIKGRGTLHDDVLDRAEGFLLEGESADDVHVGYFRRDRLDAMTEFEGQNNLLMIFVSFFAIVFVLDEIIFWRTYKELPEAPDAPDAKEPSKSAKGSQRSKPSRKRTQGSKKRNKASRRSR